MPVLSIDHSKKVNPSISNDDTGVKISYGSSDEPGVRLIDGASSFSPNSIINPLLTDKKIGSEETIKFSKQLAEQRKFFEIIANTPFEDLRESDSEDTGPYWTAVKTIDGTQFGFSMSMEEVFTSIDLILVTDEDELEKRAKDLEINVSQTYIEIDGQKYFVNMSIPMNFSRASNDDITLNFVLAVLGDTALSAGIAGIISALGLRAFKEAFKHMGSEIFKLVFAPIRAILAPIFSFGAEFIIQIIAGNGAKYALEMAASKAKSAFINAFKGISRRTFAYGAAAAIVVVAVWAFFEFVLHRSFQRVYVYNLTKHNLQFSFPHISDGKDKNTGGKFISKESDVYIPRRPPELWYNGSAFSFDSDSEFHGLGYAMYIDLLVSNPDDPEVDRVYQSFACMFEVPFSGRNSLSCQVGKPNDAKKYFNDEVDKHKETQFSASNDEFEITVTFDYLRDKHEDPSTGDEIYLYNSLVIIRDKEKISA
ncbi:MAG: hypothetical protein RPS47_01095 [Colwellia sp.]|jgi:hypothetical protein